MSSLRILHSAQESENVVRGVNNLHNNNFWLWIMCCGVRLNVPKKNLEDQKNDVTARSVSAFLDFRLNEKCV